MRESYMMLVNCNWIIHTLIDRWNSQSRWNELRTMQFALYD